MRAPLSHEHRWGRADYLDQAEKPTNGVVEFSRSFPPFAYLSLLKAVELESEEKLVHVVGAHQLEVPTKEMQLAHSLRV